MGKKKSVILLIVYTLVIAALCFICTVSFSYRTDNMHTFSSVMRMVQKDADLGLAYGANADTGAYLGGGYSAVYYPEGVISAKEYDDNIRDMSKGDAAEYAAQYVRYPDANGAIYLEVGEACDESGAVNAAFAAAFEDSLATVTERYASLREDGVRVDVADGYTIRVFVPAMMESAYYAVSLYAYIGEFGLRTGDSADHATDIFGIRAGETVADYVEKVTSGSMSGTSFVEIHFTEKGAEALSAATAGAAETAVTLYFYVGDDLIMNLSTSEQMTEDSMYITGTYTAESAQITAKLLDSAVHTSGDALSFTAGDAFFHEAGYGANTVVMLYIAFGIAFAAMMAFFFIRYRRLGFVHLYTFLLFTCAMILCAWAIEFVYLSVETFLAFLVACVLLSASNVVTFEAARKEYALGKTMASSVKTGYKKSFWKLFDLHIVLAIAAFLVSAIAIGSLQVAAFVLGLAIVFSGVGSLVVNRFGWAVMMGTTKRQGAFCNFKREEVEDE